TAVAHPSVSEDGGYLYFVSDMPGGVGGLDIWRAKLGGDEVMHIENMGKEINTAEDEMFPLSEKTGPCILLQEAGPVWEDWIYLRQHLTEKEGGR
ncbi:MAG: hypothetical protein ACRCX4_00735, partial [Bacteroidales bacterium]